MTCLCRGLAMASFLALFTAPAGAAPAVPPAAPPAPAAVPVAPADELARVVRAVQDRYAPVQRMTARIRQVSKIKPLDTIRRRESRLFFEKPSRLRWQYDAPEPVLYVSDGNLLQVYQPEDNLVLRLTVTHSQLEAALRFMFGLADVFETFDASLDRSFLPLAYRLHLVPKRSERDYKRITLVIDPQSSTIRESFVTDPLDNVHQYIFESPDYETPIAPEQFRFTPPKGATVRDLTRGGAE